MPRSARRDESRSRRPRSAPATHAQGRGDARARLIELAAEVFAEEGYAAASIRDIANRSGLSSGAIYGTFRGKADLLAEAVDTIIASDVEALPPGGHATDAARDRRVSVRASATARSGARVVARGGGRGTLGS